MKLPILLSSRAGKAFMIAFSSILLLASCSKKNDVQPEPVGELNIRAVNTVSGSLSQDLTVNTSVKATAVAYGSASAYAKILSGVSTVAFYNTGTTTTANASGQAYFPIGAKASAYYIQVPLGQKDILLFNDATAAPATGKVKIRFINLNNVLNNTISIAVDGSADILVPSIKYAEASTFFEVDAGAKFKFTGAGVVAGPAFDGPLVANKVYTIWIDGTATTLTAHLIENN
jgi:hypothetical protein